MILQHRGTGHFSAIWVTYLETLIESSWKLYHRCTQGSPVKVWKLSGYGLRIQTPDPARTRLGGGLRSPSAFVCYLYFLHVTAGLIISSL